MFGGVTRLVVAKWFLRTKHIYRIGLATLLMFIAYLLIIIATGWDEYQFMFWVSLLASVIHGVACSLGESTVLGFLKGFPGGTVGFFSSGTGFAGIWGSGLLIILTACNLDLWAIYLIASPTVIPYFLAFLWAYNQHLKYPFVREDD